MECEGEHPALAVGIKTEISLVRWEMGDRPGAIIELADALDAVELLDPAGSRQNERAHQFARGTVGLFWKKLDPYPDPSFTIAFGQPSALVGDEPLLSVDLKPLAYNWRMLALCEIQIGADLGIERRSAAKQIRGGLPSIEWNIAMARYAQAVANKDLIAAFKLGLLATSTQNVIAELRLTNGTLEPVDVGVLESRSLETLLANPLSREILRTIPLDLLLWYRFNGAWETDLLSRIDSACRAAWGDNAPILDILEAASGTSVDRNPNSAAALAASIAFPQDLVGTPRRRFERDLLLVYYLGHSFARGVLEQIIVPQILEGWTTVTTNEGFALRAPLQHVPVIEAAIAETRTTGVKGAAKLVLAAAPAVRASLTEAWIKPLRLLSGQSLHGSNTEGGQ